MLNIAATPTKPPQAAVPILLASAQMPEIMPTDVSRPRTTRSIIRRVLAAMLAVALAAPPAGFAPQAFGQTLPRLGDAAGDELTPAAERRIGEAVMRELRRAGALLDDVELNDFLNAFVARLAATPSASGHSFELFAIDDRTLNAFALPGGFIGVHTGLFASAQSESELASVLAHEIGHVTQRHIARMLAEQRQSMALMITSLVLAALAARSNPQAAGGVIALGSTLQQGQMLGFSRDAEREADRLGLEMLQQAGFEGVAMASFFERLQQASRLNESAAPVYMRTHPLTIERMGDIRNRVMESRYRQRADSLEFLLLRVRLRATLDRSPEGLSRSRTILERQLSERALDPAVAWFGLAAVGLQAQDESFTRNAIEQARRLLPPAHPYLERLAAELELTLNRPREALTVLEQATSRSPRTHALTHTLARCLLLLGDWKAAEALIDNTLEERRSDARLWQMLAQAQSALGKSAQAHLSMGEHYALLGAWPTAIEQLQLAQRSRQLSFYEASRIDVRLRELRAAFRRELEDRNAGLR
jgi:predicted Zn-dependent protease